MIFLKSFCFQVTDSLKSGWSSSGEMLLGRQPQFRHPQQWWEKSLRTHSCTSDVLHCTKNQKKNVESPSADYSECSVTNMEPPVAPAALFHPAHNWMFQQHTQSTRTARTLFSFIIWSNLTINHNIIQFCCVPNPEKDNK